MQYAITCMGQKIRKVERVKGVDQDQNQVGNSMARV